jgi:hypothetical protein
LTPACRIALGVGFAGSFACSAGAWVIGEEAPQRGTLGAADAAAPDAAAGCPTRRDLEERALSAYGAAELANEHVGLWKGSLTGPTASLFPSTRVTLALRADQTGQLRFDDRDPPEPPTDPDQPYLCDGSISGGVCGSSSGYVGGYDYALAGLVSRGKVVSFVVLDAGPWEAFCRLQTPLDTLDAAAECGHSFGVPPLGEPSWSPSGCARLSGEVSEPIDCGLLYALQHCECTVDGCFASLRDGIEVGLLLASSDLELRGSLWFKNQADAASLQLEREAPVMPPREP